MGGPIEVVIAKRHRSGKEVALTLAALAAYLVVVKVAEDVATGSWQHSSLRLRMLGARDRLAAVRDDVRSTAQFRAAVRRTLDNLETYDPNTATTEEVES